MTGWQATSGHVTVEVRRETAVVTIDRPDQLNALTADMRRDLASALRHFGDGGAARGIVLTGAGRAFSAGEDLNAAAALPPGGLEAEVESFHDVTRAALTTLVPVVAAVNGIAVGGACEITLCCDARIGSPAAEFYLPENRLGLTISNASSLLLPRLLGRRALALVLEAARLDADRALELGLLDAIVEPAGLVDHEIGLVHRWTSPGSATAPHLRLLRPLLEAVEAAFARETEAAVEVDASGIARAGIGRFLDRR